MSKKLTFAEKIQMQKESSEESDSEKLVEERVEELAQVRPKKTTRKPRKKKTEEVVEEGGAVEVPKKERKPRKKKGEDVVEGGSVETEKTVKVKRPPSAYNLFVKEAYKSEKVQKLPPKERFAKVAELWHKQKAKK